MSVRFATTLHEHGDRPALITADQVVSYRELSARVADAAAELGAHRRLVLLGARNQVDAVVWYLAALAGGHPLLLVCDDDEVVRSYTRTYDPDVVIRPAGEGRGWVVSERHHGTRHDLHPDLTLLLSTSGSTGSPKLVRLSGENLQANADAIAAYLGLSEHDRPITSLPMAYCYGLSVINSHLARGASIVLTERSVIEPTFWEIARSNAVTSFAGVPYTFDLLDAIGFADMEVPSLRYITQAGGRLAPARVREYAALGRRRGWDLYVMYGQTEATARMTYLPPELAVTYPGSIGIPIPGGSLEVAPVPDGEADDGVGELVYRGPNVMLGYAEGPSDLALGRTVHEIRTGDLGRRNADGLWEITGRRGAWLKIAGLRIDTQQVERLLERAGLTGCVVGSDDELVVAIEGSADVRSVARDVQERIGLPSGAVRAIELDRLPRLPSGKVDRQSVRALAAAQERSGEDDGPPVDALERIRALYAEALGQAEVGDGDTFVGLRGDSLSYVHVSLGLEEVLGRLPARWEATPIRELAARSRPVASARGSHIGLPRWPGQWRSIEVGVALRAIAIVLIVAQHADLTTVMGGAHILMAVAGFNFGRFQLGAAARPDRLRSQLTAVGRIVAPAAVWIAALLVLTDDYAVTNLFFLNAIVGSTAWSPERQFWFIELLVYILVAMAALFSMPAVQRAERRWPFVVALGVLAVGLAFRFDVVEPLLVNTRPSVLWLFALGWAASRARLWWQRAALVAIAAAAMPGYFGDIGREAVIFAGVALLILVPSVRFPDAVARVAGVLASASLYIYLVHWQVYPPLEVRFPVLALLASLAAGVAVWWVATRSRGVVADRLGSVRVPRVAWTSGTRGRAEA